jgi:hypothetical protein
MVLDLDAVRTRIAELRAVDSAWLSGTADMLEVLMAQNELRGQTVADLAHELGTVKAERDAMRPVVESAINFRSVKREAENPFSPLAFSRDSRMATANAGKNLEAAVDDYRARKP